MVTDLPLIAPTNGKSVFKQTYTLSSLQINSNTCKKYRFTRVLLQVSEHLLKYESESIPTFLEVHFSESGIWNPNPESKMRIHFSNMERKNLISTNILRFVEPPPSNLDSKLDVAVSAK